MDLQPPSTPPSNTHDYTSSHEAQRALRLLNKELQAQTQAMEKLSEASNTHKVVVDTLQLMEKKLRQPVVIPFGEQAFFLGDLTHTSEVLTALSSDYYVMRKTPGAVKMLLNRAKEFEEKAAEICRQMSAVKEKIKIAEDIFLGDGTGEDQGGEMMRGQGGEMEGRGKKGPKHSTVKQLSGGFLEIQEQYDSDDDEVAVKKPFDEEDFTMEEEGENVSREGYTTWQSKDTHTPQKQMFDPTSHRLSSDTHRPDSRLETPNRGSVREEEPDEGETSPREADLTLLPSTEGMRNAEDPPVENPSQSTPHPPHTHKSLFAARMAAKKQNP